MRFFASENVNPEDVRFAILDVLVKLEPRKALHRRQIANRVFGTDLVGAGITYGSLGWLESRGWVEHLPWDRLLYRVTDAGREQWGVQGALRDLGLSEEAS